MAMGEASGGLRRSYGVCESCGHPIYDSAYLSIGYNGRHLKWHVNCLDTAIEYEGAAEPPHADTSWSRQERDRLDAWMKEQGWP